MLQRKPRRSYSKATSSTRERQIDHHEDRIPISDTIQNISRTSPRDLANMKSPIKSPKMPLYEKVMVSPRQSPVSPASRMPSSRTVTSPRMQSPRVESFIASPRTQSPRMVSPRMQSPRVESPIASPGIRSPGMRSPRIQSPRLASPGMRSPGIQSPRLASPEMRSPGMRGPKVDNNIDITPNVTSFMQTPSKNTRSLYEKKAVITNLDSEETPKKIHTVVREAVRERVRNVRQDDKDNIEKEVERIIKNGDYKTVSSKLPRLESRNITSYVSETPKKNEFVPSYGDTFTRNGITYIYDDGWRPTEGNDTIEVAPVKTKPQIYKDIPNYNLLTSEQQIYLRTKFNIKFDMMRETWPQYKIPTMSQDMPLEHIHIMYNHYVKHIYARENAQNYELYVIVFWVAMQAIAVKWLGLPAQGFYKFRANRMGKYRMLLIQLGEKYHGEFGEGWPVEVKILLMSFLEIIVFIVLRLLLSLGDDTNENAVTFICDMIDRHFGITGVRSNVTETEDISIREVKTDNDNIPNISIPSLPEEANNINNITSWIPTIASKLGIDDVNPKSNKDSNSTADKIRARAANKPRQYSPPPFNC